MKYILTRFFGNQKSTTVHVNKYKM